MAMTMYPVQFKLSRSYREGIGSVVFEWALLEQSLATITYYLLGVGPKHGRVAVRNPRGADQVQMIRQLMVIDGIAIKGVDLVALQKSVDHLKRLRDLIAHGIWIKHPNGATVIQDLSGTWKPPHRKEKIARRIDPQGLRVTESHLRESAQLIRICRATAEQFGKKLKVVVEPLRNKFPQQSPPANPQNESNSGRT